MTRDKGEQDPNSAQTLFNKITKVHKVQQQGNKTEHLKTLQPSNECDPTITAAKTNSQN